MDEVDKIIEKEYIRKGKLLQGGEEATIYFLYCTACKQYRQLSANPPIGPGGTLGCPLCQLRKENPLGLEGQYGRIRVKQLLVMLPKDLIKFS